MELIFNRLGKSRYDRYETILLNLNGAYPKLYDYDYLLLLMVQKSG